MRTNHLLFASVALSVLLAFGAGTAQAAPIGIGDFSGGETVETFTGQTIEIKPNPFVLNGLTYTSPDTLAVQPGSILFENIPGASLAPTLNTEAIGDFTIDFSS